MTNNENTDDLYDEFSKVIEKEEKIRDAIYKAEELHEEGVKARIDKDKEITPFTDIGNGEVTPYVVENIRKEMEYIIKTAKEIKESLYKGSDFFGKNKYIHNFHFIISDLDSIVHHAKLTIDKDRQNSKDFEILLKKG